MLINITSIFSNLWVLIICSAIVNYLVSYNYIKVYVSNICRCLFSTADKFHIFANIVIFLYSMALCVCVSTSVYLLSYIHYYEHELRDWYVSFWVCFSMSFSGFIFFTVLGFLTTKGKDLIDKFTNIYVNSKEKKSKEQ